MMTLEGPDRKSGEIGSLLDSLDSRWMIPDG